MHWTCVTQRYFAIIRKVPLEILESCCASPALLAVTSERSGHFVRRKHSFSHLGNACDGTHRAGGAAAFHFSETSEQLPPGWFNFVAAERAVVPCFWANDWKKCQNKTINHTSFSSFPVTNINWDFSQQMRGSRTEIYQWKKLGSCRNSQSRSLVLTRIAIIEWTFFRLSLCESNCQRPIVSSLRLANTNAQCHHENELFMMVFFATVFLQMSLPRMNRKHLLLFNFCIEFQLIFAINNASLCALDFAKRVF